MNGKTYCQPCAWQASREAREAGKPADYVALQDHSLCARCGAYSGDTADHPIIGKLPLCANCAPQVANWPYPAWLKISFAAVLLLLVVALLDGRRYFHAGRTLYIGERLIQQKEYAKALPYLEETLKVAPESDKAVLLTAKAALSIGDISTADTAIRGHKAGHFDDAGRADFQEINQMWERANRAVQKAEEAAKLEQIDGRAAEASALMHEAATLYPEAKGLAVMAETADEGSAFEAKDYDRFLAIAQKQWQENPSTWTAGAVASALACKYAVTGDPKYRQQSEDMLTVARDKVGNDPAQQKYFQEYQQRIRYRLDSRTVISKTQYDQKFRSRQAE